MYVLHTYIYYVTLDYVYLTCRDHARCTPSSKEEADLFWRATTYTYDVTLEECVYLICTLLP